MLEGTSLAGQCPFFLSGYCRDGSRCPMSHGEAAPLDGPQHAHCRDFMAGYCRRGAECPHIHGSDTLDTRNLFREVGRCMHSTAAQDRQVSHDPRADSVQRSSSSGGDDDEAEAGDEGM